MLSKFIKIRCRSLAIRYNTLHKFAARIQRRWHHSKSRTWAYDLACSPPTETKLPDAMHLTNILLTCNATSISSCKSCKMSWNIVCHALPWKLILRANTTISHAFVLRRPIDWSRGNIEIWSEPQSVFEALYADHCSPRNAERLARNTGALLSDLLAMSAGFLGTFNLSTASILGASGIMSLAILSTSCNRLCSSLSLSAALSLFSFSLSASAFAAVVSSCTSFWTFSGSRAEGSRMHLQSSTHSNHSRQLVLACSVLGDPTTIRPLQHACNTQSTTFLSVRDSTGHHADDVNDCQHMRVSWTGIKKK